MNYLSVLRSILAHHVRQMESATVRCGMKVSWLYSGNAMETVAKWFDKEDTAFTGDGTNDSAQFVSLLMKRDEAKDFMLEAISVCDEDDELDEGVKYLRSLTHLAELRLYAAQESLKGTGVSPASW